MLNERGIWERRYRYANLWNFRCSECNMTCPQSAKEVAVFEFCPHCGKRMELVKEDENVHLH